jgi:type IV pilus assembly protein PilC
MATFVYEAVDSKGKSVKGTVDASTTDEAREKLRRQQLYPTKVDQKGGGGGKGASAAPERQKAFTIGNSVSQKDLTLFTRQFATLVDAGLPIVRALDIMEQMLQPGSLRNTVMDVRDEVEQGSSLSEAMSKSPNAFDNLYVSMIRAGETGGLLGSILNRLAEFREKSMKLRKQIMGAMIYPAAVIMIAVTILAIIIIVIIPKFKDMFEDLNVALPAPTQFLLDFSTFLATQWYVAIGIPIGFFIFLWLVRKIRIGRKALDMITLYLPIFGTIAKKTAISRFCRTLGELSAAGVPILDALSILRQAVGNLIVEDAIGDIHTSIREGENIADPMARSGVFDLMVVNMIEVGEETGELDKMLIKIADIYDNDIDTLVSSLLTLLEPILIVSLGSIVAFIVISLFLPLISIMQSLQ